MVQWSIVNFWNLWKYSFTEWNVLPIDYSHDFYSPRAYLYIYEVAIRKKKHPKQNKTQKYPAIEYSIFNFSVSYRKKSINLNSSIVTYFRNWKMK